MLIAVTLTLISLSSYLVWLNRWNVPAHMSLGFSITAYIIPGIFTDIITHYPQQVISIYELILLLGASANITGVILGFYFPIIKGVTVLHQVLSKPRQELLKKLYKTVFHITLTSILVIILCYAVMGFIPFFADNPFMAKFFRGEYRERYLRVAPIYRFFMFLLYSLVPITAAIWIETKKIKYAYLSIGAILVIFLSLTRAPAFSGLLLIIGLLASRKLLTSILFIVFTGIIYPLGSSFYLILSSLLGFTNFSGLINQTDIFSIIASGAPDIEDQLNFLSSFLANGDFTYGLTFIGGLIPFNFKWNPGVWTLSVLNQNADVTEIASGGLRLPVPLWGYTSFGWFGVVLVPFISGFFSGNIVRFAKKYVERPKSLLHAVLALSVCSNYSSIFSGFYTLSIYSLPGLFLILYIKLSSNSKVKYTIT